jgi:IS30 family transposase
MARRQRPLRLSKEKELRAYVHSKLLKGWSPWQIEGRLKLENDGKCIISHETIYRYIYSDNELRNQLYKKLRRKHFFRVKRGQRKPRIPEELMIKNRPKEINNRGIFGHWECDLMIFKQGIKGNLITLRERVSRYLLSIKNVNKTAKGTALAIISTLKGYKSYINSITFDQGSEFQRYDWIKECLETEIYFCEPGAPEQKGAVENVNGVIRVEFPRSLNIDAIKQDEISKIADEINERPLKCLGYKTPKEVFMGYTGCI